MLTHTHSCNHSCSLKHTLHLLTRTDSCSPSHALAFPAILRRHVGCFTALLIQRLAYRAALQMLSLTQNPPSDSCEEIESCIEPSCYHQAQLIVPLCYQAIMSSSCHRSGRRPPGARGDAIICGEPLFSVSSCAAFLSAAFLNSLSRALSPFSVNLGGIVLWLHFSVVAFLTMYAAPPSLPSSLPLSLSIFL